MRMLKLLTPIFVALALSSWASGCAIPYSREFKPKWETVIGNEAATKLHRLKLSTKLLDAKTREEIKDAKAIISHMAEEILQCSRFSIKLSATPSR